MTNISIRFEGICTHITFPFPPEGWPHRVVLARAYANYVEHHARLIIPVSANCHGEEVRAFAAGPQMKYEGVVAGNYHVLLQGVTLRIDNPCHNQRYLQEQSFLCGIPRLSVIAGKWLGVPDRSVTSEGDTNNAWAYFNVSSGTWTAGIRYKGAAVAVLDCLTEGDPVLRADAFAHDSELVTPPTSLKVASGSTLTVQYAANGEDKDDDFAIQFRVVYPGLRPTDAPLIPTVPSPCLIPLQDPPTPVPRARSVRGARTHFFREGIQSPSS